jgi:hypothetical protein
MVLKTEKTDHRSPERDRQTTPNSMESPSGNLMGVSGDEVRGLRFAEFARIFSRQKGEIREPRWIPLDTTLNSYRIAIHGTSKVLKGDQLRGCVNC